MPKDSMVSKKARRSYNPYASPVRNPHNQGSTSKDGEIDAQKKEWDDATCPICMEHPHNAVLLFCSSYDQGCRPYMCNTSYRHSNCLDQYKKRKENWMNNSSQDVEIYSGSPGGDALDLGSLHILDEDSGLGGPDRHRRGQLSSLRLQSGESQGLENRMAMHNLSGLHLDRTRDGLQRTNPVLGRGTENVESTLVHGNETEAPSSAKNVLKCPLCRGSVSEWKVVEDARHYLNAKIRSCSRETCSFSGKYEELRKHARCVHPMTRPADIDPSRQRAWRHMEHQRDYGDVLSTIRSAMPNAIVLGDYVIDNEDGMPLDPDIESDEPSTARSWWTTFFLFHMINPIASREDGRGLPSRWRSSNRHHNSSGMHGGRTNLWGENFLDAGLEESDNASGNSVAVQRRRRRRRHSNDEDDHTFGNSAGGQRRRRRLH